MDGDDDEGGDDNPEPLRIYSLQQAAVPQQEIRLAPVRSLQSLPFQRGAW